MVPQGRVIQLLLKSQTSFILYGNKATGKTTFIKKELENSKIEHLQINSSLASDKQNFFLLFIFQLRKKLKIPPPQKKKKNSKQKQEHPQKRVNVQSWKKQITQLASPSLSHRQKLNGLCILIDNIEESRLTARFLAQINQICQNEFPFKMFFVYVGVNFYNKTYLLEPAFRSMISFCMPKRQEQFNKIIRKTVQDKFQGVLQKKNDWKWWQWAKSQKQIDTEIKRAGDKLYRQIQSRWELIQTDFNRIKTITSIMSQTVANELIKQLNKNPNKYLQTLINTNRIREYMQQIVEHGPIHDYEMTRRKNKDVTDVEPIDIHLQFYPSFFLTAMHLADFFSDNQDKSRFQEFKTFKGKQKMKERGLQKEDFKIARHHFQRIVAIQQALESQLVNKNKTYPQFQLKHHSMDYYASIGELIQLKIIRVAGKKDNTTANKITGVAKEQQARAFLKKVGLSYIQYV